MTLCLNCCNFLGVGDEGGGGVDIKSHCGSRHGGDI